MGNPDFVEGADAQLPGLRGRGSGQFGVFWLWCAGGYFLPAASRSAVPWASAASTSWSEMPRVSLRKNTEIAVTMQAPSRYSATGVEDLKLFSSEVAMIGAS